MNIQRSLETTVLRQLQQMPAVAVLGPRQVGKSTLAREIAGQLGKAALFLDLERPADATLLADAAAFLGQQSGKLVVIDEVQRSPGLFLTLRGIIDERRRAGESAGHFLLTGSASRILLGQTAESLAGRIAYCELTKVLLRRVMILA